MSATVTQVQAKGDQDAVLTMGADRSLFMGRHKRHTPFAREPKEIQFGHVAYNRKMQAVVPRSADLLTRLYLVFDLGPLIAANMGPGSGARFVDDVGRAIIESVTLQSGSVEYDVLWPEFMHSWDELATPSDKQLGRLTGKSVDVSTLETYAQETQRFYVPLDFFFQKDSTQPVPLISMHLTDLVISVKLKNKADIIATSFVEAIDAQDAVLNNMMLMGEFIYLDDPERELFARSRLSYIITQNQRQTHNVAAGVTKSSINVQFNHPTKEFIVVQRTDANTADNNWFNFEGQELGQYAGEAFSSMSIYLNNNVRVAARDPLYYRVLQPSEHHSRVPSKHIYVYSFANEPEVPGSTGTLNLSRIENTRIDLTFSAALPLATEYFIFGRSVNVIRVDKGVASLKWSS